MLQKLPSKNDENLPETIFKIEENWSETVSKIGESSLRMASKIWEKLIRNCLRKERKANKIFLPNTGENLRDIFSQNQRKLENYFSPKIGESFKAFSSKNQRNFEIFFSQNLYPRTFIPTVGNGAVYGRKRRKTSAVFHRFWAVIRHSRLRNGLHRNGKRRRFVPFPLNNC